MMEHSQSEQRLSQIQTLWSVVRQAGGEAGTEAVRTAQTHLLKRYGHVVYRYLLGALRDPDDAQELSQEFALRFVQGNLQGADQQRGRFRDFLKGVLFHLIGDFHRRRKKDFAPMPDELDPAAPASDVTVADGQFLESWRSELLDHAWKALAQLQEQTGQPFHTVLQLRAANTTVRL